MNNEQRNFVLMDEYRLLFDVLHDYEWYEALRAEADKLGASIKKAIINRLEIEKTQKE
ncbi:hypothetical protein OQJ26_11415 [Legionella sp. PATHC038]|uniref:hypothetical protein n=1 Tax=Legionella sheltonii TaxID=2992041 RepID=UPI00224493B6|nr:hypothetical protein [Legionella sp. PATHC038]MCW8399400.1 hypothetical protein [Legionella sp. PATHC038]